MRWTDPMASLCGRWGRRRQEQESTVRTLVSNLPYEDLKKSEQPNRQYKGNAVKTTKYTLWSFIPKNLFEQFHRVANVYFVFLALLNFVPVVNAFQPEVALIPICVILALTAIKDGWEDFRRYQTDQKLNNLPCLIYSRREMCFTERRWKDVRVGDFVKVVSNEVIPADILLLHTSDPNGVCLIETSNLDGETNLKQRKVVPGFSAPDSPFKPGGFKSTVVCQKPNNDLNHFSGYIEKPDEKKHGFGIDSLLLRGCTIRNTDESTGIVVCAGHETKSMLNNGGARYKRSKLERKLNSDVMYCVLLLFTMCTVGALGHAIWLESFSSVPPYLVPDSDGHFMPSTLAGFSMFFTMIILLQVLIPISLYVSIELVKIGQVFFITQDVDLYDQETDTRIQCQSLNITEDLGQIQHVFSDKTGTLTENKMVFRRCTIMATEYAHSENAARLAVLDETDGADDEVTLFQQRQKQPSLFTTEEEEERGSRGGRPEAARRSHGAQADVGSYQRSKVTAAGACGDLAFSSPLETEVVPDRKLQQELLEAERRWEEGPLDRGPEWSPYLDFLVALAICNTVVVSTATAQRQRVKGRRSSCAPQTLGGRLRGMLKKMRSPRSLFKVFTGKQEPLADPFAADEELPDILDTPDVYAAAPEGGSPKVTQHEATAHQAQRQRAEPGPASAHDDDVCYEADSPDEAALVHAARAYGFTLLERTPERVTVRLPGGTALAYEVMDVLRFDSTRKRMSVLLRHPRTGEILLYTKGADSAVMELLDEPADESASQRELRKRVCSNTQRHLDMYARDGLRTLCFAKKVVSQKEYEDWSLAREQAISAIENREELLMDTAVLLETSLTLIGATGVEDRLQENVPETIEALREAGMQVWVLTGDKPETAVNIAYSCKLLDHRDLLFTLNTDNKAVCKSNLECTLEEVRRYGPDADVAGFAEAFGGQGPTPLGGDPTIGLMIDGRTLGMVLEEEDLRSKFVELCRRCRSVLCCRVTPLQKSTVVKLVREKLRVMTLAIGDGANDVNMIQAADVGIGISGQEGMQAVMASDFAISRFKHLRKLLLVHGHWCYSRLSSMVIYFFYKNLAYVALLFWFQFYCGFSGTTMIDYWLLIFFNLIFTSVPPIMHGIMDQDVSATTLLSIPELYKIGQHSEGYRRSAFWIAMLDAFYQSLVCFFIPYLTYQGSDIDLFSFGNPMNTVALFTIILHLAIEINAWTLVHWLVMVGSVLLFFGVTLAYSATCVTCNPPSNPYWIMHRQMADPVFHLTCLITVVVALLPKYIVQVLKGTLAPPPLLLARQLDRTPPSLEEPIRISASADPRFTLSSLSSPSPPTSPTLA
ncbi:phospholipid-transporting ATPase VB [Sardina pilchardus]|uniref:phospholipid-transporting ATPase VB n=1 Tax=Sardina pilchardus TaxID=27697 RepID=UPI002E0E74CB